MPDLPYKPSEWRPQGGISKPWIDEPLPLDTTIQAVSSARNNLVLEFVPYVWNIGEKLRQAQVDAQLSDIRARLGITPPYGYYSSNGGGDNRYRTGRPHHKADCKCGPCATYEVANDAED